MKKLLIILLLIVGCEKDTVAPNPSLCDGLTEIELWGDYYDIATTDTLILSHQYLLMSLEFQLSILLLQYYYQN